MKFNNICIIGLGLIGGSLAGSLKKSGRIKKILGIDTDAATLDFALEHEIVDEVASSTKNRLSDSDIIVIATHVDSITELASGLSVSENTLVTDVGSVKNQIISDINSRCNFTFIGSHPIAGSEKSGIINANPDLFAGKMCIITPTARNKPEDISRIRKFWSLTGSRIIEMEPEIHDKVFAFVSHLPHAVAFSLINSFRDNREYLQYAGGGLNDFTRIAQSSPEMWAEIFLMNKGSLLEALEIYKESLDKLTKMIIKGDRDNLKRFLGEAVGIKGLGVK